MHDIIYYYLLFQISKIKLNFPPYMKSFTAAITFKRFTFYLFFPHTHAQILFVPSNEIN